ncbi:MAG: hypothetical protein JNM80_05665 [Phycisphaerae bacterium]|nr:hypothetical protein [Phycisphaerae bacterium]
MINPAMRMVLLSGLAMATSGAAHAQCTKAWLPPPPAFMPTIAANQWPLCSILWDPDGAGPLREQLVVAGQFTSIGNPARYLARLDCTCYANCDGSAAAPAFNINDFVCFQNKFAAGCP